MPLLKLHHWKRNIWVYISKRVTGLRGLELGSARPAGLGRVLQPQLPLGRRQQPAPGAAPSQLPAAAPAGMCRSLPRPAKGLSVSAINTAASNGAEVAQLACEHHGSGASGTATLRQKELGTSYCLLCGWEQPAGAWTHAERRTLSCAPLNTACRQQESPSTTSTAPGGVPTD